MGKKKEVTGFGNGGTCECKLDLVKVSLSFGVTGAVLSLLCAVLVWLSPEGALWLFKSLVHSGIQIAAGTVSIGSAVTGGVIAFVLGTVLGVIFVPVYNYCQEHCR